MDALNIRVNEKFDLLPIIEQGGIVRLKIMLDDMLFVSEAVVQALHTWILKHSQEVPSKIVVDNIKLLMIQFLAYRFRLADVNKISFEVAIYLLEGLTKCSVEKFSNLFDIVIQQERVGKLSSGFSMGLNSLSTLVEIKSIVKLSNTSYHYL